MTIKGLISQLRVGDPQAEIETLIALLNRPWIGRL